MSPERRRELERICNDPKEFSLGAHFEDDELRELLAESRALEKVREWLVELAEFCREKPKPTYTLDKNYDFDFGEYRGAREVMKLMELSENPLVLDAWAEGVINAQSKLAQKETP